MSRGAAFDIAQGNPFFSTFIMQPSQGKQPYFYAMVLLLLLIFMSAGCLARQAYPSGERFGVDPGVPAAVEASAFRDVVLRVEPVRVAPPFATRKFTYRTGEATYEADYYNGFIDTPDRLLTASLTEWLAASGACRAVIGADSAARDDVELETNVVEFYGDYRQPKRPYAVVTVRFFLLERHGPSSQVVLERRYTAAVPLETSPRTDGPAALAKALGLAWREMLSQFTADLRQHQPQATSHKPPSMERPAENQGIRIE
jgi:uncharacterized lipoprotein YmbA